MFSETDWKAWLESAEEFETSVIESLIFESWAPIVFDCSLDVSLSFRISSATTLKPFPASPACAASMAAFMAKRFVCSAMAAMAMLAS